MKFAIRNTSIEDIAFYRHCFDNAEFKYYLYGNDNVNLDKYLLAEEPHLKFVISKVNFEASEHIGFCHFYYHKALNEYCVLGGISPELFNSGVGLYASVAILSYLFRLYPKIVIHSGVFKYNQRNIKMLSAIGFQISEERADKLILKVTQQQFKTEFVKKVLKRIEILE